MELGGLIVGLGNPGEQYRKTRHNFGFMAAEALLRECEDTGGIRKLSGQRDAYDLWRLSFGIASPRDWLLAMPLTYMNRSGDAVQRIAAYYRIASDAVFIIHDEVDLPLGRMKLKKGGGSAGHNGIRSIEQMLGTPEFYRLRLGVGKAPGASGTSWVLGRFTENEGEAVREIIAAATRGVRIFIRDGERKAQQFCNGFALSAPERDETQESGPPARTE